MHIGYEKLKERVGMSNPNESYHSSPIEPKRGPGIGKAAGAAIITAGVLGTGVAAIKVAIDEAAPPVTATPEGATEQPDPVPASTAESTSAPVEEILPMSDTGAGPEIGSAATVERVATPEQNAEFQSSAIMLAASIIDLYNQGIGSGNFIHTDEQSGRQYLNVINDANDKSGYYALSVELPVSSLNPADVLSVHVAMVQDAVGSGKAIDANHGGHTDSGQPLYSMYLDSSSGTNWELGYEVDAVIDIDAAVGSEGRRLQVGFAQQIILRTADGAPIP